MAKPSRAQRARQRSAETRKAPASPASPGLSGTILPDLSVWEQFQRVGGNLTPHQVSQIIRTADTGDPRRLIDLANEMRQKDGHLQSVLSTRETALLGLKWELFYPGQDPKSSKGKNQRKFVERALRICKGLRRTLAHLTSAIYYGFSVAEVVWATIGGKMLPERIVCHSPRRFRFREEDGLLVWQDQDMSQGVDFRSTYAGKFLVSQPRINGDVECREGLARVLMWPALFRNWTLSDWLKLAEIAWKPWRIGKYSKKDGASTEDIEALKQIVAGMSASGAAVHPDTVSIELMMPSGTAGASSKSDHSGLFDTMGREMSKAVLGQTLTTEGGKVGSQALGNVHNDVRKDVLESDAEWLAEVINEQLIAPLILLNYGPKAAVPRFRFITTEAADIETYANAIEKLAKVLRIPAEWVRDKLGIPEPKDGDELVQDWVTPAPETSPANDDGAGEKPADDEEDKDEAA